MEIAQTDYDVLLANRDYLVVGRGKDGNICNYSIYTGAQIVYNVGYFREVADSSISYSFFLLPKIGCQYVVR